MAQPAIFIVDDEEHIRSLFSKYLSQKGYLVKCASSLAEAREVLPLQRFSAVLLDLNLPDGNGLDYIEELRNSHPGISIIVITGTGDVPLAVEAMRRGADNFLTKPVSMTDVEVYLQKNLELGDFRRKHFAAKRLNREEQPYFGESPAIQRVKELAALSAENNSPVILLGETGSGKGVLARWIHNHSQQRTEAFVEINCSSLRGELLASELFGHTKGAFTTAVQDRQGLIEVADGGTLFLDEIGDMDTGVQAQFLKVIEEKQFRRLGEVRVRRSEFRLMCATNRDLRKESQQGKFREDLYFRTYVFPIHIPPLRERAGDITGFAMHILETMRVPDTTLSAEVRHLLECYQWPGNIRELKNVMERAVLLSRRGPLKAEHFPGLASTNLRTAQAQDDRNLNYLEEAHIRSVIRSFSGDTKKASQVLGISRATLYRKLNKLKRY